MRFNNYALYERSIYLVWTRRVINEQLALWLLVIIGQYKHVVMNEEKWQLGNVTSVIVIGTAVITIVIIFMQAIK